MSSNQRNEACPKVVWPAASRADKTQLSRLITGQSKTRADARRTKTWLSVSKPRATSFCLPLTPPEDSLESEPGRSVQDNQTNEHIDKQEEHIHCQPPRNK
jgi:hypothetical protein